MENVKNISKRDRKTDLKNSDIPVTLATVDDRGQVLISKEVRDWGDIQPGDKIALFRSEMGNDRKRVIMVKLDDLVSKASIESFVRE